ncbi:hypothetical protein ACWD3I_20255 [Streptomyces sp. NPDC002817]|uniref:hypothetical protein n=1 Tax=Streptomyces sp. NPDC088357 TaxID=3154655 RepID=UPI00343CD8F0
MTGRPANPEPATDDQLRAVYQEICLSYRAIDDFRAKLLSLLPVVSGASVGLLIGRDPGDPKPVWLPIGLFGFVVSLGLFAYELYGIEKCGSLIHAGRHIELGWIVEGQFVRRPHALAGFMNEPFAAMLVYPAVLAGWMYVALARCSETVAVVASASLFLVLLQAGYRFCRIHHRRDKAERAGDAEWLSNARQEAAER